MRFRPSVSSRAGHPKFSALGFGTAAALVILAPRSAAAQAVASDTSSDAQPLQEVVVTAEKHQDYLSRTPVADTVVTPVLLEQQGITSAQGLNTVAPDTQLFYVATGGVQLSIRGISTNQNSEAGTPSVAFYVNGVYDPLPEEINSLLFDVDRIEVLRGPQGTLYGQSSSVGAINVYTATPTHMLQSYGDISYGNYNDVMVRDVMNVPVSDTLAVRAAIVYDHNDGYVTTPVGSYAKTDTLGARLTTMWTPTENFSWELEADQVNDNGVPPPAELYPSLPGNTFFHQNVAVPGYIQTTDGNVRSRMVYKVTSDLSITDISGYGSLQGKSKYEMGGMPVDDHYNYYDRNEKNWSNELDLNYDTDSLEAVAGLYYFGEKPQNLLIQGHDASGYEVVAPDLTLSKKSYAAFGQATYDITQSLKVTGGVRWTEDRDTDPFQLDYICPPGTSAELAPGNPCLLTGFGTFSKITNEHATWNNVSWKGGIEDDINRDTLVYATVSTGFKSGVLGNSTIPSALPERSTNYELGWKQKAFNDRIHVYVDLFWMNYRDLQVSSLFAPPAANGALIEGVNNAGKARSRGIEGEFAWALTGDDQISGYFSYDQAKYLQYLNAFDFELDPNNGVLTDNSGHTLPFAPAYSGRLSYEHTFHIGEGTLVPNISVYAQSHMWLTPFNDPMDNVEAYSRTDITLTYYSPGQRWSVEGYVHNLEDNHVPTMQFNYSTPLLRFYSDPRLYGIRFGYKMGYPESP